jgi:hypothetical protein
MKTNYTVEQIIDICKQLFPRYIDCAFKLTKPESTEWLPLTILRLQHMNEFYLWTQHPLQLKSLTSITEEDCKKIAKLIVIPHITGQSKKLSIQFYIEDRARKSFSESVLMFQYLQSKGYALPQLVFLDDEAKVLTVDEQIELGIIEIIK